MDRKAFTLIELIMVIAIIGIIAMMTAPFISTAVDSWLFSRTERDVVFSARLAMNRMIREIREINGTDSVLTFTNTTLSFNDIDNDSISYQQSGTALLRNSDELTDKLRDPGGLSFNYLDSSGNVTAVKAEINMVRVKLILDSGDSTISIQSLARLRNE